MRIARLYAHAEEKSRALNWLEKAYEERESTLLHLKGAGTGKASATNHDFRPCRDESIFRSNLFAPKGKRGKAAGFSKDSRLGTLPGDFSEGRNGQCE